MDVSNWTTVPWLTEESTTATAATSTNTATDNSVLGKDDFLKLLVTELQYQNPLEPMEDRDFIAQMASFSSLEQMQNMNTAITELTGKVNNVWLPNMMMQQASSMIGREVAYYLPAEDSGEDSEEESTEVLAGVIESVLVRDGTPVYIINGDEVSMDNILELGTLSYDQNTILLSEVLNKLDLLVGTGSEEEENNDG